MSVNERQRPVVYALGARVNRDLYERLVAEAAASQRTIADQLRWILRKHYAEVKR